MRLRYSLKTALIFAGVVALGLAALSTYLSSVKKQWAREQQAINALQNGKGEMFFTKYSFVPGWLPVAGYLTDDRTFDRVTVYEGPMEELVDSDLRRVSEFLELRELNIQYSPSITDKGVTYITSLKHLEVLDLHDASVTDAALSDIGKLRSLRDLCLSSTKVTDKGIPQLVTLTNLRDLSLADTAITDESLPYLCQLPRLEELTLQNTSVTDAGLSAVGEIRSLKKLWIDGTQVTEGAIRLFQKEHPNVSIEDH